LTTKTVTAQRGAVIAFLLKPQLTTLTRHQTTQLCWQLEMSITVTALLQLAETR
jgi:hypothetical protein